MAKTKQQQLRMQIKALNEDGTFEGVLSPYNNVDDGGDVVEPGAFTKTLQENGSTIPLLWQHMTDCPIGELALEDKADGLHCSGKLVLEVPEAKKAYLLMKAKIVKGLSIGYDAIKAQVIDGVRHLKEIRLWEGSAVTFPMNRLALVTSVKSRQTKGDFTEELTERQLWDAGYQMICALQNALGGIPWTSELSRDEMIAAADTVLQQFHDAYMEYFPAYLDLLADAYGLDTKSWAAQRETKRGVPGDRFSSLGYKEGRKLSAATRDSLSKCHEHMKSAIDLLAALLTDEAGEEPAVDDGSDDATSKHAAATARKSGIPGDRSTSIGSKSGAPGYRSSSLGYQSEPENLHSAAEALESMRALLRA